MAIGRNAPGPRPPRGEAPGRHITPAGAGRAVHPGRPGQRPGGRGRGVLRLSRSRRWLAPLALAVGAFAMLFDGVKLLFTNWRLTLIQVLPAMWIWAAMFDLKAHVLHGKPSTADRAGRDPARARRGRDHSGELLPERRVRLCDRQPGPPRSGPRSPRPGLTCCGPGIGRGRRHPARPVYGGRRPLGGVLVRASLSIVIGVMMVCYVAVRPGSSA